MTNDMIKELLDTCFLAKKIVEKMPELPRGLKPRHMHIIAYMAEKNSKSNDSNNPIYDIKVSDVSKHLRITTPSVTKLINELETLEIVIKKEQPADKRVTLLSLTDLGYHYYKTYVLEYHGRILKEISDLDMNDCRKTINTIERLYKATNKISIEDVYE